MIELNKPYTTEQLAKEMNICYQTFRKSRVKYEQHLDLFYEYTVDRTKKTITYVFTRQYGDFIPYKQYIKNKKNQLIKDKSKAVIACDPRQTGANIARIICVESEIQALNYELSTLTVYTRANLKEMIKQGYYSLEDYKWCFLDPLSNKYVEMTDKQIEELRGYFRNYDKAHTEEQENLMSQRSEGLISKQEANEQIGEIKFTGFMKGIQQFMDNHNGRRPIKVPLYVRNAIPVTEQKEEERDI